MMQYVSLGRTGVQVSQYCLGTMNFGSRTPDDEAKAMINYAIEQGVNFIDTANVYGNAGEGVGHSEKIIGKTLKGNGKRDRLIIATKVRGQMNPDDPNGMGIGRHHIIQEVENSLRRLQTDTIDLYQLHSPMQGVPIDETLRALDDLIHTGKVRYIGTSNFRAWQIIEGLWTSSELHLNRFVSEQPPYSMVFRHAERELLPMAQKHTIAILPWSPLWGGILTGKYQRDQSLPDGSRFTFERWKDIWGKDYEEATFDLLDLLTEIAREKNCSISQLALAWTAAQPAITSVIIGPRTVEQLEDNLGAVDVEITDEDCERIDAIAVPGGALAKLWGR
jgi:aryl-alcohol dehydrogenase-like predicted oxidoreductase